MALHEDSSHKSQFREAFTMSSNSQLTPVEEKKSSALSQRERNALAEVLENVPEKRSGLWTGILGGALGLLWLGGTAAYLAGFAINDFSSMPIAQIGGIALFITVPAIIFLLAGLLGREIIRASSRAERLEASLTRLSMPADATTDDVSTLADAISGQINRVNVAMESALARLAAMEEVITHHADSLEDSTGDARQRTEVMVRDLRKERDRLAEISDSLDDKAALIASAIQDQSKMVAAAAELAEAKVSDGERLLKGSAERLTAAGAKAEEAGERVALALDARSGELRDFVDTLKLRTEGLEAAYLKHRDRLTDASEVLRKEQEKIAAALDFHKAELENMSTTAREGADTLKESATESGKVFIQAVNEALGKARDLSRQLSDDSEAAADTSEEAVARLKAAAQAAREAAEEAATRFDTQADAARAALERVNEAGFTAARQSDEAFQKRLKEAEELTERATSAANVAAEKVREQLEVTVKAAADEGERIEKLLSKIRSEMESAPQSARKVVEDMEKTLSDGLHRLNQTAAEASENAREVDQIFQARVRQNYELLSDFMLRMGSVAGGRKPVDLASDEVPDPLSGRRKETTSASMTSSTDKPASQSETIASTTDTDEKSDSDRPERVSLAALAGKKAPTTGTRAETPKADRSENDQPRKKSVDSRPGSEGGWRWKDILATMEPEDDPKS